MSSEFEVCANAFGWTLDDMQWLTLKRSEEYFYQFDLRLAMIDNVTRPVTTNCARPSKLQQFCKFTAHGHQSLVCAVTLYVAMTDPMRRHPGFRCRPSTWAQCPRDARRPGPGLPIATPCPPLAAGRANPTRRSTTTLTLRPPSVDGGDTFIRFTVAAMMDIASGPSTRNESWLTACTPY